MKKIYISFVTLLFITLSEPSFAQSCYWQQQVDYKMNVKLDVSTNKLTGIQHLVYTNNSPDTLRRVFFHLYWNAFQPGSMMDVRSRESGKTILGLSQKGDTIRDWDRRVRDRIAHLAPEEIGYDSVITIKMNDIPQKMVYHETILEIPLSKPIPPKTKATFDLTFKCRVPIQIRRSGRDNAEGVRYSMSQWYPKMSEYDYMGWHPTPYIAREFYGVWGNYDIKITIDKNYLLGATGYLQNAREIGYGYEKPGTKVIRPKTKDLTWHFYAPNVHDFVWGADPDYEHISAVADNKARTVINVIYKKDSSKEEAWHDLLKAAIRVLPFMEKHFGPYPFKQYSFIQGGDGGMEYPMATLIKGPGLGAAFHEWMHSWYQMMMGTNESLVPWMDEGFTTYAEGKVSDYYFHAFADSVFKNDPEGRKETLDILDHSLPLGETNAYRGYFMLVRSGLAEPMTTHADHYSTNFAYEENAYSKGAVFLEQLGYIVGDKVLDKILLEYYKEWKFKHPNANDFIRVTEKVSGMKLDWYEEYWIWTTKTIDYGIDSVLNENGKTKIVLHRIGEMPMPIDLSVTFKDGHQEMEYVPAYLMFGQKPNENSSIQRKVYPAWPWTNPVYELTLPVDKSEIKSIEIDPTQRMADVNRSNNKVAF